MTARYVVNRARYRRHGKRKALRSIAQLGAAHAGWPDLQRRPTTYDLCLADQGSSVFLFRSAAVTHVASLLATGGGGDVTFERTAASRRQGFCSLRCSRLATSFLGEAGYTQRPRNRLFVGVPLCENPMRPSWLCMVEVADMRTAAPNSEAELCSACGELIADRFLLRVSDSSWHARCLRCCVCGAPLDRQPSCFVRHGSVYCRHDYVRIGANFRSSSDATNGCRNSSSAPP
ncbi:hypothetical protein HPB50_009837 [Hyalomma asiaticum]|uniref:Uncharacterized protein n=1 Tax=Hyalomma asiaticum TaxID=266040 RepID=A0ACB7TFG7_HYAAI|nr:hypothetical protein HPB50_009837 [Hyalomma asiaticum]